MTPEEESLKAATRQAHEVLQDLKVIRKEIQILLSAVDAVAQVAMEERIDAAVEKGLDEYKDSLTAAIDAGTAAVFERFDILADELLGETRRAKRKYNGKSLKGEFGAILKSD